jgi:hypothetical protein
MEFHGIMKHRLMEFNVMEFHGIPWNFVNWRNSMEFGFDRAAFIEDITVPSILCLHWRYYSTVYPLPSLQLLQYHLPSAFIEAITVPSTLCLHWSYYSTVYPLPSLQLLQYRLPSAFIADITVQSTLCLHRSYYSTSNSVRSEQSPGMSGCGICTLSISEDLRLWRSFACRSPAHYLLLALQNVHRFHTLRRQNGRQLCIS